MKIKNIKAAKIFRWVWRINALFIFAVGLFVIGAICVAVYPAAKNFLRGKPVLQARDIVNVEQNTKINSEWTFGGFNQIEGTNFMMSPVYSKQDYQIGFGGEKSSASVRNYFFLNSKDHTSHWLAPTNQYLFLDFLAKIGTDEIGYNVKNVRWLKYRLVKADTNLDGRLTAEDKKTIAISNAAGDGFFEVVEQFDDELGMNLLDADTLIILFRNNDVNYMSEIKLSEQKVTLTSELPKLPANN